MRRLVMPEVFMLIEADTSTLIGLSVAVNRMPYCILVSAGRGGIIARGAMIPVVGSNTEGQTG